MVIFVFDRIENTVGKGENAGHQHFLIFPQCFEKDIFPIHVKKCHCVGIGQGVPCILFIHNYL